MDKKTGGEMARAADPNKKGNIPYHITSHSAKKRERGSRYENVCPLKQSLRPWFQRCEQTSLANVR